MSISHSVSAIIKFNPNFYTLKIFLSDSLMQKSFCQIFLSVQFSRSVVSDSLRPHELQYARPPCPSPTPEVYPNSCPLSQWCHPTISSSVITFSSCPQPFPELGSLQMSQLFTSSGQSFSGVISPLISSSILGT